MQLSCTSGSFSSLSFEQAAIIIGLLDLDRVDVDCYTGGQVPAETVLADPRAAAARIMRAIEPAGIGVSQIFFTFGRDFFDRGANSADHDVRRTNEELVLAMAQCALLCGARGLTTLPGVVWPELGPERSLALAVSALRDLVAVAGEVGLPLQVEPHLDSVIDTPERARTLADQVPGLRLTLDYAHFLVQGYHSADVHELLPFAGHLHARHAAAGHLQTPARRSELDFADIGRRLLQAGYEGDVCLEFVPFRDWGGIEEVDVISQTAQLRDILRAVSP
jgi:sugar phosphate isomerase/epimerase